MLKRLFNSVLKKSVNLIGLCIERAPPAVPLVQRVRAGRGRGRRQRARVLGGRGGGHAGGRRRGRAPARVVHAGQEAQTVSWTDSLEEGRNYENNGHVVFLSDMLRRLKRMSCKVIWNRTHNINDFYTRRNGLL